MRLGSLFSGMGGLDRAIETVLGTSTAWVCDNDPGARRILAHRYPDVPNLGDVTTVDWSAVEPVDVLCGGFPCQPVSHAGKRLGDLDERWLWDDFACAIGILRPGLVVLENVRGLLSAGNGRLFGRVLGALAGLGYEFRWHGLRAADVGAPHGRWRVFVVAYPCDGAGYREWARQEPWQRGAAATDAKCGGWDGWAPEPFGTPLRRVAAAGSGQGTLLPTPRTSDTNGAGQHGDGGLDLRTVVALLPTPLVGSSAPAAHGQISGQWRAQMAAALAAWGKYADAITRWEQLTRPAPPPTETGPKGNPRLSPAFVEWMLGLPAGWVTDVPGLGHNQQLKALGNGVVPAQATAALRLMLDAHALVDAT